jgi:hypothetical protein
MKLSNIYKMLVLLIGFNLVSCKPSEINDAKDYFIFLSNPKNGLVKEKSIAGIKYRIKYLPTDYLVYNASKNKNYTQITKDSLIKSYSNSLTFIMNIGPAEDEDFDITRLGVSNYKEFAQRIEEMAFDAQEWINISSGGKEYKPAIVRMENINAQDNSRDLIVVFSTVEGGKNLRESDLCLSYNDALFNTGVNKFIFKSEDLLELPGFKF